MNLPTQNEIPPVLFNLLKMGPPEDDHLDVLDVRVADVPIGWSDHQDHLRAKTYFTNLRVNETLHPSLYFSRPRPILTDTQSVYMFEEQGRGYYLWNEISGGVAEIKENSWEDIIAKLKKGGLCSLSLSWLRTVDDPSGEPTSNIPYLPNPDFVDRPHLTGNFQIPPQRSVLLYGWEDHGKSELAIQYASEVRTRSPETWVFWLCATTEQKFEEDLAAIANLLPEGPPTDQEISRRDFVLDWLCTQHGERWLLIIDDVRSDKVGVLSVIDKLWHLNEKGSFLFTSVENLQDLTGPSFTSSSIGLKVDTLLESEALHLLRRKLKRPLADADGHNLVTGAQWTPLAVELAAASVKQGLISISELSETIMSSKRYPVKLAFDNLFKSLYPYERNLLFFISTFSPPEVPRLWLRSYLEWKNYDQVFNPLEDKLQSLIKSSLLVEISGANAYKMQSGVRLFVIAELVIKKEWNRFYEDVKSFVDSRKYIPNHRLSSISRDDLEKLILALLQQRTLWASIKRRVGLGGKNVRISDTSIATDQLSLKIN